MSISMSSASLPVCATMLGNLSHMLTKARAFVETKKSDPGALTNCRLAPDMLPFTRHAMIACDAVKNGVVRRMFVHMTMAYAILRYNGVALGKADYLVGAAA
ncbi:MAG: DUF1993 domain-containing protein [Rhodoferax sp.]|nr:DUF1993 domain-containing protein [Rhodoferax sp.]